jgi:DNA end-binding protein Ku
MIRVADDWQPSPFWPIRCSYILCAEPILGLTMAARAMWKATLNFVGESIPVKLYSAVEDRSLRFHMLEEKTPARITQKLIDPDTSEEVPREKTQKAYEVQRGVFVLLSPEELQAVEPPKSDEISITRFVPPSAVGPEWYQRPYYLGPDGKDADYFAFAKALEQENRLGIAKWVMRKKRYVGALRAHEGYLMLMTLRWVEEVVSGDELPKPTGRPLDAKELKMAEQLILALEDEFKPEEFRDEYRDRVMKFIESKAHGQPVKLEVVKGKKPVDSIAASLAASLKMLKADGKRTDAEPETEKIPPRTVGKATRSRKAAKIA